MGCQGNLVHLQVLPWSCTTFRSGTPTLFLLKKRKRVQRLFQKLTFNASTCTRSSLVKGERWVRFAQERWDDFLTTVLITSVLHKNVPSFTTIVLQNKCNTLNIHSGILALGINPFAMIEQRRNGNTAGWKLPNSCRVSLWQHTGNFWSCWAANHIFFLQSFSCRRKCTKTLLYWSRLYSTQDLFLSAFVLEIVFTDTRPKLDDENGLMCAAWDPSDDCLTTLCVNSTLNPLTAFFRFNFLQPPRQPCFKVAQRTVLLSVMLYKASFERVCSLSFLCRRDVNFPKFNVTYLTGVWPDQQGSRHTCCPSIALR